MTMIPDNARVVPADDPFAAPVAAGAVAVGVPAGAMPAGAAPAPVAAPVAPPVDTLPDDAYAHKVGEIVKTSTGFGVIVDRGATRRAYVTAQGRQEFLVPGYVVAPFGTANETPHTAEELGFTS